MHFFRTPGLSDSRVAALLAKACRPCRRQAPHPHLPRRPQVQQTVSANVVSIDTELVREWFNAFAMNAGVTLHVETLYGENSHHISESCFKGLARALRTAVAIDPRAQGEVPSTKGQLGG